MTCSRCVHFVLVAPTLILLNLSLAEGIKAISFQEKNQITTESSAVLELKDEGRPPLTNLSVCTWLYIHFFREGTYVFSYATSDDDNNELNMGIKEYTAYIAIGGSYHYGWKNATYVPGIWYHFCFTVHDTIFTVYVNGKFQRQQEVSKKSILLTGSLVLGQEADLLNGGFQAQQAFSGILTGFNLYSRALSEEEVAELASCSGASAPEGDVVAWSTATWTIKDPTLVKKLDLNYDQFCQNRNQITVFPEQRHHSDSLQWCTNLKAEMSLPRNPEQNGFLYEIASPFVGVCQPPNHAKGFLWIAATDKDEEGVWTDLEGEPLDYTNFKGTYKSKSLDCAGMLVPPYEEEWDDIKCSKIYKFCVPCEEQTPSILKMRGLCENDEKAAWFRLRQKLGEKTAFRGFTRYKVELDKATTTWYLFDYWRNMTLATYYAHDSSYPIGKHTWTLASDYMVCGKPKASEHEMAMSACYDFEYSCGDATCINLTQRCDLRVDCPDATDETGCEKVSLPPDYLPSLTPPGVLPGPLRVNLSLNLHGFSEINIRDMKLTVDFTTYISWFDIRVNYHNLKDLADINHVQESLVWTPTVDFANADFPFTYKTSPVLTVQRESPPEEDDPSRPVHDEVYEGRKNPLQMMQQVNAPFTCVMNLRNFPFDTQHCKLLLRLASARVDFLTWHILNVTYLGQVLLTEYEVGPMTISHEIDRSYSMASVNITLYRRFWFYVTSAYLPTVMLMLISYASLFVKRENADLRVMMSLTTLLVLYALYQQISNDLPRTSYTKAIDVWCFFAITFIFTMVIFHVLCDIRLKWLTKLRRRHRTTGLKSMACHCDDRDEDYRKQPKTVMTIARLLYAVVVFFFFIVYWVIVIVSIEQ